MSGTPVGFWNLAGMDVRNSGRALESSEIQLGGGTHPGNPGLEVWKWSGIPDLLSALVTTCGLGPCHVVHLGTVLNHVDGLHMNKIAARPSTHHDGPEVYPDMVVKGTMVRGGVVAEWAKGNVYFYRGGNVVHDVHSLGRHPCHSGRMDNIVQSDVLLLSVLEVVAVDGLIEAIHQHSDNQFRGGLLRGRHPLYLRKSSLYEGLCLLEALFRFFGMFLNPGQQPVGGHEVSSVPILFAHIIAFLFQFFQQEFAVIGPVNGFQER